MLEAFAYHTVLSAKAKIRATSAGTPHFTLEPQPPHVCTHAVIFLPGICGRAHGSWRDRVENDWAPKSPTVRWIVRTPPKQRVSGLPKQFGRVPAHYDIHSSDFFGTQDVAGIERALERVAELVRVQVEDRGLAPQNVLLGGYSQGGSLALAYALAVRAERHGAPSTLPRTFGSDGGAAGDSMRRESGAYFSLFYVD